MKNLIWRTRFVIIVVKSVQNLNEICNFLLNVVCTLYSFQQRTALICRNIYREIFCDRSNRYISQILSDYSLNTNTSASKSFISRSKFHEKNSKFYEDFFNEFFVQFVKFDVNTSILWICCSNNNHFIRNLIFRKFENLRGTDKLMK